MQVWNDTHGYSTHRSFCLMVRNVRRGMTRLCGNTDFIFVWADQYEKIKIVSRKEVFERHCLKIPLVINWTLHAVHGQFEIHHFVASEWYPPCLSNVSPCPYIPNLFLKFVYVTIDEKVMKISWYGKTDQSEETFDATFLEADVLLIYTCNQDFGVCCPIWFQAINQMYLLRIIKEVNDTYRGLSLCI